MGHVLPINAALTHWEMSIVMWEMHKGKEPHAASCCPQACKGGAIVLIGQLQSLDWIQRGVQNPSGYLNPYASWLLSLYILSFDQEHLGIDCKERPHALIQFLPYLILAGFPLMIQMSSPWLSGYLLPVFSVLQFAGRDHIARRDHLLPSLFYLWH